jgi:putative ABC transport system substrate-binding protein
MGGVTQLSRRAFVGGLAGLGVSLGLLAGCVDALTRSAKVPRLGFLYGSSAESAQPLMEATQQGLRDLGYAVGQNLTTDYRFSDGRPERASQLAAELVALNPDVLLAFGNTEALAAKQATLTIPIVVHAGNLVGTGLVSSLSRPDGNVTGISISPPGLYAKRLDLLKQPFPTVRRVGVFTTDPSAPAFQGLVDEAPSLGVQVQLLTPAVRTTCRMPSRQ